MSPSLNESTSNSKRANQLRWALITGLAAMALLVIFGVVRFPSALDSVGYQGLLGIAIILVLYGAIAWFGPAFTERRDPYMLKAGLGAGLIVGLIFVVEILAEYVFLPQDNTPYGLAEYGAVLAVFLLVSLWVAGRQNSFRKGLAAAVWSALIGSVIWYVTTLLVFHLFFGTPQQTQVFRAEGDYNDILRSGMTDFGAFIVQDFMGAGFYHSLILPVVAGIVGTLGSGIGKLTRQFWKP